MRDRLAVQKNAGGLSAVHLPHRGRRDQVPRRAGKARNRYSAWAPAEPGLIRLPNRRDHDDCLLDADRGGDDAVPHHRARQVGRWRRQSRATSELGKPFGLAPAHGLGARNHFEAFPAFAAAVFVAELTHAPQSRIDQLAGIFVLLRVIYTALYVADQATLRSVAWSLGLIAVLWLFVLGV